MWYVIQVKTGEENAALESIKLKVDSSLYKTAFIPYYEKKRKVQGEWKTLKHKLFPGYVIIDTEEEKLENVYEELKNIPKLTKLLSVGDKITPVTYEEEEFFKGLMDEDYMVRFSKGYIVGDEVNITEGALKNSIGRIKKIDRHKRIAKLQVKFCGRDTEIEVGLEIIEKIDKKG